MKRRKNLPSQSKSKTFAFLKSAIRNMLVLMSIGMMLFTGAFGYEYTANNADQAHKSNFKVDPVTLGMSMEIPLGAYPNRGGGALPISIRYSSKVWRFNLAQTFTDYVTVHEWYKATYGEDGSAGWVSSLEPPTLEFLNEPYNQMGGGYGYEDPDPSAPGSNETPYYIARMTVHLLDGSAHELRQDDVKHTAQVTTGTFVAVDGTGMKYDADSKILYMTDGSRYFYQTQVINGLNKIAAYKYLDANGNKLTYNAATRTWTDTLERSFGNPLPEPRTKNYGKSGAGIAKGDYSYYLPGLSGNLQYTLKWRYLIDPQTNQSVMSPDANGNSRQLKYAENRICTSSNSNGTVSPALFDSGSLISLCAVIGSGTAQLFNPIVLSEVVLPDGRSYQFKYNEYGEIDKATYPTGSTERFEYAEVSAIDGVSGAPMGVNRGVIKRWVSETGLTADEALWTYSNNYYNAAQGNYFSRMVAPDGTITAYRVYLNTGSENFGFGTTKVGKIYETAAFKATGEVRRRNLIDYFEDSTTYSGYTARRDARPVREISLVFEDGASSALAAQTVYEYDSNADPAYRARLNIKRMNTYDFTAIALSTAQNSDIGTIANLISSNAPAKTTETYYLYDANYLARNMTALPSEVRLLDAVGAIKSKSQFVYDEGGYTPISYGIAPNSWENPGTLKRGQVTTTRNFYDISAGQYIETHLQTDQFGQPRKMWDGEGNLAQTEYETTYYTYPVRSITPKPDASGVSGSNLELQTTTVYDANTGLPLSVTDADGHTATMEYNDALLRPTRVTAPNGQQAITEYGAGTSASTRYVKSRTQIDSQNWKESYSWYDGLGRTVKSQSVDSGGDVFAETQYDNMGRAKKATNPYRTGETIYWTESFYDDLSRVVKVKTPDLAEVNTAYSLATTGADVGTAVTVTDQALKQRRSITNGLGQLTRVDEPTTTGLGTIASPNQYTNYSYDSLNNLTMVTQGAQTRSFVYDSLSRLKSATNPESGTINYGYDNNGNLTTKSDARSITTTYAYDALNRVISRSYNDNNVTPAVSYFYDNLTNAKGKLIKVSSSVSQTEYTSFDNLGRVLAHKQTTDGQVYNTAYSYNLSGALIEETYPSGRVVKNVLDNDGDLSIVQSKKNAASGYFNYAKNFTYTAAGAVSSMQLGNGKWESTAFNSRLQPTQIALGTTQNGTDKLKLDFTYNTPNVADNNGNVLSQTITTPAETIGTQSYSGFTATQNYTYDSLNRIEQATETITGQTPLSWQQTFIYDRYGNRTFDQTSVSGQYQTTTLPRNCPAEQNSVCPADNPAANASNNQLVGFTFDNAGNTQVDAQGKTFTYDAENKQTKVVSGGNTVGEYFYDGDGKRVKKIVGTETTIFIYNASSKLVAEYSTTVAPVATAQVSYLTSDHLGSPRINTDRDGKVVARHDYQPFGEEVARVGYGGDAVRQKFTSYERDNETELDFAQARYVNNSQGRFMSPDPYIIIFEMKKGKDETERTQILYEYLSNPQNWTGYNYALNNPLVHTDPTGMRPPSYWEQQALNKLDSLISDATNSGDTDLANGLTNAKNEISKIIDKLKKNQSNFGVNVATYAILSVGSDLFATAGGGFLPDKNGKIIRAGSGSYKCNIFVAAAYVNGGHLNFISNGQKGSGFPLTDGAAPAANYLGDARDGQKLSNLGIVTSAMQPGDIVAWRANGGNSDGHSSINIGGGVVIYSGGPNEGRPTPNTLSGADSSLRPWYNSTKHEPYTVRRYNGKP